MATWHVAKNQPATERAAHESHPGCCNSDTEATAVCHLDAILLLPTYHWMTMQWDRLKPQWTCGAHRQRTKITRRRRIIESREHAIEHTHTHICQVQGDMRTFCKPTIDVSRDKCTCQPVQDIYVLVCLLHAPYKQACHLKPNTEILTVLYRRCHITI